MGALTHLRMTRSGESGARSTREAKCTIIGTEVCSSSSSSFFFPRPRALFVRSLARILIQEARDSMSSFLWSRKLRRKAHLSVHWEPFLLSFFLHYVIFFAPPFLVAGLRLPLTFAQPSSFPPSFLETRFFFFLDATRDMHSHAEKLDALDAKLKRELESLSIGRSGGPPPPSAAALDAAVASAAAPPPPLDASTAASPSRNLSSLSASLRSKVRAAPLQPARFDRRRGRRCRLGGGRGRGEEEGRGS